MRDNEPRRPEDVMAPEVEPGRLLSFDEVVNNLVHDTPRAHQIVQPEDQAGRRLFHDVVTAGGALMMDLGALMQRLEITFHQRRTLTSAK
jgi:hypothetical protein